MDTPYYSIFNIGAGIAEVVFWVAAILLLYAYVGYPTLLALVALFCRPRAAKPGSLPRVSVVIAAYNEEASIGRKIAQTLTLSYPADKLEILVASDGSTDRTDSIVKSFNDTRVRLLRIMDRHGKTHAQNEAVKQCTGDILVFSDATAAYHPKALMYLAGNYTDPSVGAVSGRYDYFDPEGDSPTGPGSVSFWSYENTIKKLQSRILTLTGCSGCIYSVRRNLYTPLPDDIISDLVQPLWVVKKGYRVIFEDRALAYEETTRSTSEEFGMRVRVVARGIRGILSVHDLLKCWEYGWLSLQLLSHKILRWLVPLLLILLLASDSLLIGNKSYKYLFFLQMAFYSLALVSARVPLHKIWKPLGIPMYFCVLNAAALFGLLKALGGSKFVTWETVRR